MARISAARRPSTLKVYEGKWRGFARWCSEKGIDPCEASTPEIADFLLWLFHVKKLAPITLKGYRAMLSDTFRHTGRGDLGQDRDISDLLANLARSRPVLRSFFPSWNLPWVLTYLNSERFEPLELAPLKELTLKTCFLLALATASRVSELHAFSAESDYLQRRTDGSIALIPRAGFLAKNRVPTEAPREVVVRKLTGGSHQERLQDPVRELKKYLARTKSYRPTNARLFLPLRRERKEISSQTISRWIKSVIKDAYLALSPEATRLLKIRAHEVRAISTSVAFSRNVATADILAAVGWRSSSTFAKFYLRDLTPSGDSLRLVGQVAVPGRPGAAQ